MVGLAHCLICDSLAACCVVKFGFDCLCTGTVISVLSLRGTFLKACVALQSIDPDVPHTLHLVVKSFPNTSGTTPSTRIRGLANDLSSQSSSTAQAGNGAPQGGPSVTCAVPAPRQGLTANGISSDPQPSAQVSLAFLH